MNIEDEKRRYENKRIKQAYRDQLEQDQADLDRAGSLAYDEAEARLFHKLEELKRENTRLKKYNTRLKNDRDYYKGLEA